MTFVRNPDADPKQTDDPDLENEDGGQTGRVPG